MAYFYSVQTRLARYGCKLNISMGVRRAGKTYSSKVMLIKRFLKKGSQFCWVRNTVVETSLAANPDFYKEMEKVFPDVKFEMKTDGVLKVLWINDKIAGYFVPLRLWEKLKGRSLDMIDTLVFDEFLVSNKRNERNYSPVTAFMGLVDTIDNRRDKLICYLLANAVSETNDYFKEWCIELPKGMKQGVFKVPGKSIVIEKVYDEGYAQERKESEWGQIMCDTQYAKHSYENEGLFSSDGNIINTKPAGLTALFALQYYDEYLNFYKDSKFIYVELEKIPANERVLGLRYLDADRNELPYYKVYNSKAFYKVITSAIDNNRILYISMEVKEILNGNL